MSDAVDESWQTARALEQRLDGGGFEQGDLAWPRAPRGRGGWRRGDGRGGQGALKAIPYGIYDMGRNEAMGQRRM